MSLRLPPKVRRAVLLPAVVFLLSTGLVFATGTNAQAYAGTPSPVTIGKTALKSPAGRVLTTVGSMTPWGRAVKIGMLAYATKDAWWPVAEGFFKGELGTGVETDGAVGSCQTTVATLERSTDGASVLFAGYRASGCHWSTTGNGTVYLDGTCYVTASGITSTFTGVSLGSGDMFPYGANGGVGPTLTRGVCGNGAQLVEIRVTGLDKNGGRTWSYPESSHQQVTTVTCKNPETGATTVITDTETGNFGRVVVPSCADRVPGTIPWSGAIKGGPSATSQKEYVSWGTKQDVYDEYADCFGPGGLLCEIRVYVDGQPCTLDLSPACRNFKRYYDDPLTRDRVQCRFGSHVIDFEDCATLNYKAEVKTKTVTQVDPDGQAVTEPEVEIAPSPAPSPAPTTGPNPEGPATRPDTNTDADTRSCFGDAWSWNPVDWVYVPVKCTMIWAFVPKNAPSFSDVPNPLPAGWLPDFPDVSASACGAVMMPRLDFNGLMGLDGVGPVTFFDTCQDPWPLARTFVYNGLLAGVLVTVMWRGYRAVATSLGMGVDSPLGGDDE